MTNKQIVIQCTRFDDGVVVLDWYRTARRLYPEVEAKVADHVAADRAHRNAQVIRKLRR